MKYDKQLDKYGITVWLTQAKKFTNVKIAHKHRLMCLSKWPSYNVVITKIPVHMGNGYVLQLFDEGLIVGLIGVSNNTRWQYAKS